MFNNKIGTYLKMIIIGLGLGIFVFFVMYYLLNDYVGILGTSTTPLISDAQYKQCGTNFGSDVGEDSDGDGYPDSCDPCVDVHNDYLYGDGEGTDLYNAINAKYNTIKWNDKVTLNIQSNSNSEDKFSDPDHDGDHLHDACEWEKEMKWASQNWLKVLLNKIDYAGLADLRLPSNDAKYHDCKFYYSGGDSDKTVCCSRPGTNLPVYGKNGLITGKTLPGECTREPKK